MRVALLICLLMAAAASACGAGSPSARVNRSPAPGSPGSAQKTRLTITFYPNGIGRPGARQYELSCNPARGTVPHPADACRALARTAHPFAAAPARTVCGFIVLGPEEARITGVVRGQRISTVLTLRDTCEIGRWNELRAVVPGYPRR
jgi:Subtilisin inhibitor-like